MKKKISINMLSSADKVPGQGVGSAYLELVKLLDEDAKEDFDIEINKGLNYDILHAHTIDPQNFLKLRLTKAKKVAYVHFLPDTLNGSIKLPKPIFKIFKKYVIDFYKSADKLVVVNPIFIKDMVNAGLDKNKIIYIPNFVSKEEFYKKNVNEVRKVKEEFNIDKNSFVVLGAGQVQTRKGVLDFVEVAKKLPDITFVWAGGFSFGAITDGHADLKKVMDNPPKNVKFIGIIPREKMNDLYNMANVLFVPSYNELFPMTILEAMSTETPLLLRDLDLYKAILFDKYLKGNTNEEFIQQLDELKNNSDVYEKAIKNSNETSRFYSKEHVLEMWKDFYSETYIEESEKEKKKKEKKELSDKLKTEKELKRRKAIKKDKIKKEKNINKKSKKASKKSTKKVMNK